MSLSKTRLERANWHFFALSKMLTTKETSSVRQWCKANLVGDFYVAAAKETSIFTGKLKTIATMVRIESIEDAVHFKLKYWCEQ